MFNKKKCDRCGSKIEKDYNFCPYCRNSLEEGLNEDWGLLGKNDSLDGINFPMGFNHLFTSLIKNLDNQFKNAETSQKSPQRKTNIKKGGISISISTSGNRPPEIKVSSFGNTPGFGEKEKQISKKPKALILPSSDGVKFFGVPKQEPQTNVRRLSNKVVYEIEMPGVTSIQDLSIIQLENSIEIKALGKGKVFHKILPINLPIKDYNLSKGKLVLELDAKE